MGNSLTVLRTMSLSDAQLAGHQLVVPPMMDSVNQWVYEVTFSANGVEYPAAWVDHASLTKYVQAGYMPTNMLVVPDAPVEVVQGSHATYAPSVQAGAEANPEVLSKAPTAPSMDVAVGVKPAQPRFGEPAADYAAPSWGSSANNDALAAPSWGGNFGNEVFAPGRSERMGHKAKEGRYSDKPFKLSEKRIYFGQDSGRVLAGTITKNLVSSRGKSSFVNGILYPLLPFTVQSALMASGDSAGAKTYSEYQRSSGRSNVRCSRDGVDMVFVRVGTVKEERAEQCLRMGYRDDYIYGADRHPLFIFEKWLKERGLDKVSAVVRVKESIREIELPVFSVLKCLFTPVMRFVDARGYKVRPYDVQMYNKTCAEALKKTMKALGVVDTKTLFEGKFGQKYSTSLTGKRLYGVSKDMLTSNDFGSICRSNLVTVDNFEEKMVGRIWELVDMTGGAQPNDERTVDKFAEVLHSTALQYLTAILLDGYSDNGVISFDVMCRKLGNVVTKDYSAPRDSTVRRIMLRVLGEKAIRTVMFAADDSISSAMDKAFDLAFGGSALYNARIRLHLLYNAMKSGKYGDIRGMIGYEGREGHSVGDLLNPETIVNIQEILLHPNTHQPVKTFSEYMDDIRTTPGRLFVSYNDVVVLNEVLDIFADHCGSLPEHLFEMIVNSSEGIYGKRQWARNDGFKGNKVYADSPADVKGWIKKNVHRSAVDLLNADNEMLVNGSAGVPPSVYCQKAKSDIYAVEKYEDYINKLFNLHSKLFG